MRPLATSGAAGASPAQKRGTRRLSGGRGRSWFRSRRTHFPSARAEASLRGGQSYWDRLYAVADHRASILTTWKAAKVRSCASGQRPIW